MIAARYPDNDYRQQNGLLIDMIDDPTAIDVSGSDDDVARWIWKRLVPKSGEAAYVQAEILRAIEKLRWEAQGNGNINWDDRFEALVNYVETRLVTLGGFSAATNESIRNDCDRLRNFLPPDELTHDAQIPLLPYIDDDLYDRLTAHLICLCRASPKLVRHPPDADLC